MRALTIAMLALALTAPARGTIIAGLCFFDCDDTLDGLVGIGDLLQLLSQWGTFGAPCDPCFEDVGIDDFLGLLRAWGPCPLPGCGPGGAGDTCSTAIPLAIGTVFGTTSDNTASGAISCCAEGALIDEWYCFVAPEAGTLVLSTCNPGTGFDARLTAQPRCDSFEQCGATAPCERGAVLTELMWTDDEVLVRVTGRDDAVGAFELTAEFTPVPDECNRGTGDCCADNGTPGCDHALCCAAVCEIDPFCCDVAWDSLCADEAGVYCTHCL